MGKPIGLHAKLWCLVATSHGSHYRITLWLSDGNSAHRQLWCDVATLLQSTLSRLSANHQRYLKPIGLHAKLWCLVATSHGSHYRITLWLSDGNSAHRQLWCDVATLHGSHCRTTLLRPGVHNATTHVLSRVATSAVQTKWHWSLAVFSMNHSKLYQTTL